MGFFTSFDLTAGYWQIKAADATKDKLAFYTPDGLYTYNRMPMGALNSAPVFVSFSNTMQIKWNKAASSESDIGPDKAGSKVIVDDIIAFAITVPMLFTYIQHILDTIRHYRATIKLKKCKWLHRRLCFVGVDVTGRGNLPAQDKHTVFNALQQPNTFADL
jgi:hypothetical protein